ncbi:MAG: hypothetical protein ABIO63_03470 [Casimicrobiaceae bacterium]
MLDPRRYPPVDTAPAPLQRLFALVETSLASDIATEAAATDAKITTALDGLLAGEGAALAQLFAAAPSAAAYRHLWRLLVERERAGVADAGLRLTLFAMPLVIVAALEDAKASPVTLPGVVDDIDGKVALLREHRALSGNENFAIGNALIAADAIEFAALPALLARRRLAATPDSPPALAPAPIAVAGTTEAVHLRFLVGTALAAPTIDPLRVPMVGRWGIPLASALARDIGVAGVTVLALPRAPTGLVPALWEGRVAQREVSAQLFASNAIRRLRSAVGEPQAVLSVHGPLADGGGEVRLSLSSPFDPREAEGFRCPLLPLDRVDDVVKMLQDLLRECRVDTVHVLAGLQADRDPATGMTLLFKGDALPVGPKVH